MCQTMQRRTAAPAATQRNSEGWSAKFPLPTEPHHNGHTCEERQQGVQPAQGGENTMFSHIMIGSNDIARSKKFYDALFAAMGAGPGVEDARGRVAYSHNGGRFMLTKPIDGKPATVLNGGTIGFQMKDAAQAEAWHKAGVANGGSSIEDPPGVRPHGAYLAYLRDPDGHKLVGVVRPAS
jgi:catechol 2,3-dioxygenase-like lactoylglutathione lyase family enzyme